MASHYLLGKVSSNFSENHRLSFREKYYSKNINVIVLLKVKTNNYSIIIRMLLQYSVLGAFVVVIMW